MTGGGGGALVHPLIAAAVTSKATDVAKNPIVTRLQVVFITLSIHLRRKPALPTGADIFVASGYGVCVLCASK